MERKRELQEHRAKSARTMQRVKTRANFAFVLRRCRGIVREALPKFRGKQKTRIGAHAFDPLFGVLGAQRPIKRSVDFNRVEELCKKCRFVESFWARKWINI